jgi:hypothetical protein
MSSSETSAEEFLDKEAPYGRFANGKPRKSPPGSNVRGPAKVKRRRGPAALSDVAPDYKAAASGVVTIIGALLGLAGRRRPAFLADSAAVMASKKELAEVGADLALTDVRIARWLEQIATATPLTKALDKLAPVVSQVLTNHGLAPVGTMGSVDPAKLIAAGKQQEAEENKAAGRFCGHCGSPAIVAMDAEGVYYCQEAVDELNASAAMSEAAAVVAGDFAGAGVG